MGKSLLYNCQNGTWISAWGFLCAGLLSMSSTFATEPDIQLRDTCPPSFSLSDDNR
ncbi:MAG: hypothetical protein HOG02_07830, partial [Porticoccaceae bacterium]|nr:hypothetical protein [Porticoccaceae bacterium]